MRGGRKSLTLAPDGWMGPSASPVLWIWTACQFSGGQPVILLMVDFLNMHFDL
jgi:hypothetical protein